MLFTLLSLLSVASTLLLPSIFFLISESLPASSDGAPRGNIFLFDVVLFQQINRLALTLTQPQIAHSQLSLTYTFSVFVSFLV